MSLEIENALSCVWLDGLTPSPEGAVPAALVPHLFGGSARTYAVIDTGLLAEGLTLFESEPGFRGSLLEGDDAEDLADVAPCLVELSSEDGL